MSWLDPLPLQILIDFDEASCLARRREYLGAGFLVRTIVHAVPRETYGSTCSIARRLCPTCGEAVERREGCRRDVHLSTGGAGCRRSARAAA